jgi:hypothetical protein
MIPVKPDMCLIDGKVAVFIGGAYAFMTIEQARTFTSKLQSLIAHHKREERRKARIGNGGAAPTGHAA